MRAPYCSAERMRVTNGSLSRRPSGTSTMSHEPRLHFFSLSFTTRARTRSVVPISTATGGYFTASEEAGDSAGAPLLSHAGSFNLPKSMFSRLLDKGHLVDLAQSRQTPERLVDGGLAQEHHSFFLGRALDLGGRFAVQDQLADVVAQIEDLGYRRTAFEAGAVAVDAPSSFVEGVVQVFPGLETRLGQQDGVGLYGTPAFAANPANE